MMKKGDNRMRRSDDMFGSQKEFDYGVGRVSEMTAATVVLSMISVLMIIFVVANFRVLTATIAIGVAELLSTGIPIVMTIIAIIYFVIKIRWNMRRRFWGW